MKKKKKERERSYESYSTPVEGQHKDGGFPRRRKQGGGWGTELFIEVRAKNTPNLGEELDIHVHEAKRTLGYL